MLGAMFRDRNIGEPIPSSKGPITGRKHTKLLFQRDSACQYNENHCVQNLYDSEDPRSTLPKLIIVWNNNHRGSFA